MMKKFLMTENRLTNKIYSFLGDTLSSYLDLISNANCTQYFFPLFFLYFVFRFFDKLYRSNIYVINII